MRIKQLLGKGCMILGGIFLLIAALLLLQNASAERNATNASNTALAAIAAQSSVASNDDSDTTPESNIPNGSDASNITVDGATYGGVLAIASLNLSLPIQTDFSYDNLKSSPCIYTQDDNDALVIAAHNYTAHFGSLPQLSIGDAVTYTTLDGNTYTYTVSEIVTIEETDLAAIDGSAEELVLFTCNINDNSQRVVVRCNLLLL
ncbi:MAG: sortase [Faecalibacterium sp.]